MQLAVQQGVERLGNQQRPLFVDVVELEVRSEAREARRGPGPRESFCSGIPGRELACPSLPASGISAPDRPAPSCARKKRIDLGAAARDAVSVTAASSASKSSCPQAFATRDRTFGPAAAASNPFSPTRRVMPCRSRHMAAACASGSTPAASSTAVSGRGRIVDAGSGVRQLQEVARLSRHRPVRPACGRMPETPASAGSSSELTATGAIREWFAPHSARISPRASAKRRPISDSPHSNAQRALVRTGTSAGCEESGNARPARDSGSMGRETRARRWHRGEQQTVLVPGSVRSLSGTAGTDGRFRRLCLPSWTNSMSIVQRRDKPPGLRDRRGISAAIPPSTCSGPGPCRPEICSHGRQHGRNRRLRRDWRARSSPRPGTGFRRTTCMPIWNALSLDQWRTTLGGFPSRRRHRQLGEPVLHFRNAQLVRPIESREPAPRDRFVFLDPARIPFGRSRSVNSRSCRLVEQLRMAFDP